MYGWINNLFALIAERADSYAFYSTDVWLKSLPTFIIAAVMLVLIAVSWLKPVIDTDKCISCRKCERNCKASCIDIANHKIDYSRCVTCMDCIGNCPKDAISYIHPKKAAAPAVTGGQAEAASGADRKTDKAESVDTARRGFLTASLMAATAVTVKAQEKKVDGGLAVG